VNDDKHQGILPYWASVAFIARCARRYAELISEDNAEPRSTRSAIMDAVRLAELRASSGGEWDDVDYEEIDGQFFDNYDIVAVHEALRSYAVAASNTVVDQDGLTEAKRIHASICLAILALEAAYVNYIDGVDEPPSHTVAIDWVLYGEPELLPLIEEDLSRLEPLAGETDEFGVPPTVFGALWPKGRPPSWPVPNLTFRPRARILRTIGDRLISGPEAAVIELVKNSYDADAATVKITFVPPLQASEGQILIEDDGHGMSFSDIQNRWMEPATSDKKTRQDSPKGRRLLGSKGIGRFAVARLGQSLELTSIAMLSSDTSLHERTTIEELDWDAFDKATYLDQVSFPIHTDTTHDSPGTVLRIWNLRDDWSVTAIEKLHHELRRLIHPNTDVSVSPFKIIFDLSLCTEDNSGFDGASFRNTPDDVNQSENTSAEAYEIRPFPILEACDYDVDGIFDESGSFDGTMTIRRDGKESESISLTVPLQEGENPCGVVDVRLSIFDRETNSIRSTAESAGFGHLGVRDARKLLDSIAGIAIYRDGFRLRPYGDSANDWLSLDTKRVQNPSIKIGRNQVAGTINIDDEHTSKLIERSSREGLEENGSYRRLQSLILTLLAEVIEPKRRKFRIAAGLEKKKHNGFKKVFDKAALKWAEKLITALPESERAEAQKMISKESDRLVAYLKELEGRQAQLEAQVTIGAIVGEVMHQGNTPLAFIETEVARLNKWWPDILSDTKVANENLEEVPKILNGLQGNSGSLRELFEALKPLSGARRGDPKQYCVGDVVNNIIFLFRTKAEDIGLSFLVHPELENLSARGYSGDLSTALTNLIDNAIYWLDRSGIQDKMIEVSATSYQDSFTLFMGDNGNGVPEDFRDQLFDIGFTLKPSGTGLGLNIAREAVFRSGGELELLDSAVGAKFAITLPSR